MFGVTYDIHIFCLINWQRLWLRLGVNVDDQLWLRLNPGMTKYITGLTGTIVNITPQRCLKCYIGPSVAWLSMLSSARPPPTLLLSGVLIGGGGYMTAPSPLVPGRSPVTSFC